MGLKCHVLKCKRYVRIRSVEMLRQWYDNTVIFEHSVQDKNTCILILIIKNWYSFLTSGLPSKYKTDIRKRRSVYPWLSLSAREAPFKSPGQISAMSAAYNTNTSHDLLFFSTRSSASGHSSGCRKGRQPFKLYLEAISPQTLRRNGDVLESSVAVANWRQGNGQIHEMCLSQCQAVHVVCGRIHYK